MPDITAARMQATGAESTCFDFVKSRKSRLSKTAFGTQKGINQKGGLTLPLRPREKEQPPNAGGQTDRRCKCQSLSERDWEIADASQ